ncbi:Mitochondrial thiamine pyrophosphate carrier 1 [Erysiphe neolycopersici]|uniref:Mitochondrial thiamine pyrophosphate carrier 1 n=1 Tax=Erysiphe neolycopersici TaxID=212602 RepID=A0A420H9A1_9PEZI|nr:Mitochondrial thiamine pyrophosphate carrier 1 [Erysiphe neolycopersici]
MYSSGKHLKDEGSRSQVVIAGAISGMIARFFIAPLDVIKIRLQLQTRPLANSIFQRSSFSSPLNTGALFTLKNILKNEGITALWKGNVPAELMYISYSAIQFTTYRSISLALQSFLGENYLSTAAESFIAGAFAGATATTATYPLDLLRTRLAAQGKEKIYRSLAHSVREIYKSEGSHGFFRGLGAGVGQIIPHMGIFFSVYETLRLPLNTLHLPFSTGDASAGVLASVIAKTCVFPFDLVRKRLQVQGPTRSRYVYKDIPNYHGIFQTFRKILTTDGPRGLYRGLTVSLLKSAPTGAIVIFTYERTLHMLMKLDEINKDL